MAKLNEYEIEFAVYATSAFEKVKIKAPDAFAAITQLRLRRGGLYDVKRVSVKRP